MDIFLKTVSALNDETRVKIIKFLNINGDCCVCDLESSFDMIQSRLSRHLKILKEAGFLKVERTGRWAYFVCFLTFTVNLKYKLVFKQIYQYILIY